MSPPREDIVSPLFSPPSDQRGNPSIGLDLPPNLGWPNNIPESTFGRVQHAVVPNGRREQPQTRRFVHRRARPGERLRSTTKCIEAAARRARERVFRTGRNIRIKLDCHKALLQRARKTVQTSTRKLLAFDSRFRVSDAVATTACATAMTSLVSGFVVAAAANAVTAVAAAAVAVGRRRTERGRASRSQRGQWGNYFVDVALREDKRMRRGY